MIVNGPDGTPHEFPDDATNDEILKFFGKSASSSSSSSDQPTFTSRMLTGLGQLGQNADDDMRLFGRGWTMGLGDRILGGPDAVKATNDASARQGWWGAIPETLGMITNPVADAVGAYKAGKLATAAAEGAIQSGVQSYSHNNSPGQIALDALKGSGISTALQPVAGVVNRGLQKVGAFARDNTPSASDIEAKIANYWNSIHSAKYAPKDVQATARASQNAAASDPSPLTEITNPKAWKLYDDFSDYSGDPTSTHSVRELRGWQDKANSLTGDDARFGANLSDNIDGLLSSKQPITAPKGMLARDVPITAAKAQDHSALLDEYNKKLAANPTTVTGKAADILGGHSWGTAHHIGVPLVAGPLAAIEGFQHGGVPMAVASTAATLGLSPAIQAGTKAISNAAREQATVNAMQAAIAKYPSLGSPTINNANEIRRLLFGGYQGAPN